MPKEKIDINQGIKGKYSKLKLAHHPEKLKALREQRVTPPIYVRVKPTNACNHNCFYCLYQPDVSGIHTEANSHDKIPREKLLELLKDFQTMGVRAVTYSGGGEPLVHPNIIETLETTVDKGLQLSMITNGQCLEARAAEILGQKANWVRVSADYCDAETFAKIRKIPERLFERWKDNMSEFAETKSPECNFGVNFVVNEYNFDKIYQSAELFKELGFENLRFSLCWGPGVGEYHEPFKQQAIEQIQRVQQDLGTQSFEVGSSYERDFEVSGTLQRSFSKCYFMQIVPAIGADQKVYFCHNKAYDSSGLLGSIEHQSFRKLWFSEEVADKLKSFDPRTGCCHHHCTNDEKNQRISEIVSVNETDPIKIARAISSKFGYNERAITNEIISAGDPRVVNFI